MVSRATAFRMPHGGTGDGGSQDSGLVGAETCSGHSVEKFKDEMIEGEVENREKEKAQS